MKVNTNQKARIKGIMLSLLILSGTHSLTACVPVLVVGATVTAITVATDRRTLGRNLDDNSLELDLRKDFPSLKLEGASSIVSWNKFTTIFEPL